MGDETCDQRQEWAREVVNLSRERGSAAEWPLILGAVTKVLGANPVHPPIPDLRNPDLYLDFFARAQEFAISP